MIVDLANPVPDIAECVLDRGQPHRVTGWYRVAKRKPIQEKNPHMRALFNDLRTNHEVPRRLRWLSNYRVEACKREEAIAIGIYAVGGGIVRIDEVVREGKYVDWSDEWITEHRDSFLDSRNNLGAGYESLIRRLVRKPRRQRRLLRAKP